jgi:transmembrane sensor
MKKIFVKYINRECTEEEVQQIIEYFKTSIDLADFPTIESVQNLLDAHPDMELDDADRIYNNIQKRASQQENKPAKKKRYLWKYAVAAIFIGLIATTYVVRNNTSNIPRETTPILVNTIVPGTDKATLTLEDGSIVALEKGVSFQTKNANSNGKKIIYKAEDVGKKTEVAYNYLTIPRGGQFFIELSDGTKVWLNSESQLKYPVSFIAGETRQVELIYGEAYFDVSPSTMHNGAIFMVVNQGQEVEVLGTEFNVKAYKDEQNVYTTLVEGKVKINAASIQQLLVPNEQSNLDRVSNIMSVSIVDVKTEVSWKMGVFSFKGKPLKDIMKVIARWYDVEVVFENKELELLKFKGVLEKAQPIGEILSIMKSSSITDYQIKDKVITLK